MIVSIVITFLTEKDEDRDFFSFAFLFFHNTNGLVGEKNKVFWLLGPFEQIC